jgi:hypothetical protein
MVLHLSIAINIFFVVLVLHLGELMQLVTAQKKNVLIGYAVGYKSDFIRRYVTCFLKYTTVFDDVVVFTSTAVDRNAFSRPDNVIIIKVADSKNNKKTNHYQRFEEIYSFLLSTQQSSPSYGKVISTDVRDVLFQANPFDQINSSMGVMTFNEPDLLLNNPWNKDWVSAWYGEKIIQTLLSQNFTVINVSYVRCCGIKTATCFLSIILICVFVYYF